MLECRKATMRTIALINQKGGVGKTTVALHLAAAVWQRGPNTLILDLDPQASAAEWHDARSIEIPHVESIQPARLTKVVEHAREIATGILILDPAPHAEAAAIEGARCAALVLVGHLLWGLALWCSRGGAAPQGLVCSGSRAPE